MAIIQSLAQLQKNYGKEGAEIIVDNTQNTIFGGFAPNSTMAETLSKALGEQTILSGSVSKGRQTDSQSLQMIGRPLNVDRANYECVYTAPITADTGSLEKNFEKFNINRPKDFTGHSLSVSDIVTVSCGGQQTAHYVDSIGFKEIPGFLQPAPQKNAEKESVLEKIRESKQAAGPKKTTQKKHDKSGPEL